jgi:hypothetical protein
MPCKICVLKGNPIKLHCWYIPAIIIKWPKPGPGPFLGRLTEAVRLILKPQPDPWVSETLADLGTNIETIRDARILATVDALAAQATPAVREALRNSLDVAGRSLTLPQGSTVTVES